MKKIFVSYEYRSPRYARDDMLNWVYPSLYGFLLYNSGVKLIWNEPIQCVSYYLH